MDTGTYRYTALCHKCYQTYWVAKGHDCVDGFPAYEHYEDKFKMNDSVEQPKHYEVLPGVEAKDIIRAVLASWEGLEANAGSDYGNVLKYVLRAPKKNGLEDLKKARKYLNWLIEGIE